MAARIDLHVFHVSNVSTFGHLGNGETIPNISLASEVIVNQISDWQVLEDYAATDHQAISFGISSVGSLESTLSRHK